MIIIWGTRLFGDVYNFNGVCIAIKFFHLWYLPLIPLKPYLVVERSGGTWRGIPLAWSLPYVRHSLLIAYARAFLRAMCVFALIVFAALSTTLTTTHKVIPDLILVGVLGLASLALLRLSREYFVGNQDKMDEIAARAGLRSRRAR